MTETAPENPSWKDLRWIDDDPGKGLDWDRLPWVQRIKKGDNVTRFGVTCCYGDDLEDSEEEEEEEDVSVSDLVSEEEEEDVSVSDFDCEEEKEDDSDLDFKEKEAPCDLLDLDFEEKEAPCDLLDLTAVNFDGCSGRPDLSRVVLKINTDLTSLEGLAGADHSIMVAANFKPNANFSRAILKGVYCPRANFQSANLKQAILSWACLSDCNFKGANMAEADLSSANLSGASLENASLDKITIRINDAFKVFGKTPRPYFYPYSDTFINIRAVDLLCLLGVHEKAQEQLTNYIHRYKCMERVQKRLTKLKHKYKVMKLAHYDVQKELTKLINRLAGRSVASCTDDDLKSLKEELEDASRKVKREILRRQIKESFAEKGRDNNPHGHFICPISLVVMEDPVFAADGQTYDRKPLEKWINGQTRFTSPLSGIMINANPILPNHNLKSQIESALDQAVEEAMQE